MTSPDRAATGVALLVAAIVQIAAPAIQSLLDTAGPAEGSADLLITPAGWAFSIWSLIYLLTVVHAIVAIVRDDGVGDRRLVVDLVLLYLAAALWIVLSSSGENWATFLVLAVMVVLAVDATLRAVLADDTGWTTWLARATTGLYAGWVSAAAFLNLGTAAIDLDLLDPDHHDWQIALLVLAILFALAVNSRLAASPTYAVAVVWAMIGIAAEVAGASTVALVITLGAIVLLVAQTAITWVRRAG